MTSVDSNAPRSGSGGVTHIRTRQTSHFTVLANRLAQRAGSAVTVGVAAYLLSLPDGAPVTIAALCAHFREGKIAIAAALRELEAEGWLERRVERGPRGRITTRTLVYDLPGAPAGARPAPAPAPEAEPVPVPDPAPEHVPEPAPEVTEAAALLADLPLTDRRLLLSEREVASLAPAVADWLDRGATPGDITAALTTNLPDRILRRPVRLLAYRLAALRPARRTTRTAPAPGLGSPPAVVPLQNCDGCDRAFRASHPGRCLACTPRSRALSAPGTNEVPQHAA
ncbi:hypothetical protein [Streptomyces olivaceiscleroticus]|uniref:Helix-turn-helix domain-containing protein n=1 Tax=Streptomyces olivaceiscleroticus TaxID=68245 RepID=A0ABN1AYK3_9ACTN